MLWARLNRGGPCGGVSWRRPVLTVTVTVEWLTGALGKVAQKDGTHDDVKPGYQGFVPCSYTRPKPVWPDCWRMGATPKQATRRRVNSVGYCYHVDERLNGCQHQIGHWSASGTASIGA